MTDPASFLARPFPAEAWTPEFRQIALSTPKYLPPDWLEHIHLDPPDASSIEADCRAVLAATRERAAWRDEILLQADEASALIWPIQRLIGNPVDPLLRPASKELARAVLWDLNPVTFYFKTKFNRGRPCHCCTLELKPMFERPDRLYPGHPSYPSGHSTQAHVIAFLYSQMFPSKQAEFVAAAQQVARNREIAGLHFPSDSVAGAKLAEQFLALMMKQAPFKRLVANAQGEWPDLA